MSIWHKEVVRLEGTLKAYLRIQDDWTGQITEGLRNIRCDGDTYYCNVGKQRVILNQERELFLRYEDKVKTALDWYNKTKF